MAIPASVDDEEEPSEAASSEERPTMPIDLSPMDQRDDAGTPAYLPKSGEVGSWIKTEAVRVLPPQRMAEIVLLNEATRFDRFRLTAVGVTSYSLPREGGDGKPVQAHVLFMETETPSDAYGLLTCEAAPTRRLKLGGQTRIENDNGIYMHLWQGRVYLRVWSEAPSPARLKELRSLAAYMAGKIPPAGKPELIGCLPTEGVDHKQIWLVRHLGAMRPKDLNAISAPEPERLDDLLGLNRDTLMVIAAYEVPQAQRWNVVWVVRYTSETDANRAYQQYSTFLTKAVEVEWASTNLLKPHGTYLLGTWTVEEESLLYILPRITQRLLSQ